MNPPEDFQYTWGYTFPENPEKEPSQFFHRLTLLAISSYCYGRKLLPKRCFNKRVIHGHKFYTINKNGECVKHLCQGILNLKEAFNTQTLQRVSFLICGKSKEHPIEALNFNFSFDRSESQMNAEESLAALKERTYAEVNHLNAVAKALPPFSASHFPIEFQLRYELTESGKENTPTLPNYKLITVDPNIHQLYGNGASDSAFCLPLHAGQRMEIWYHSLLIKSVSEIDNQIAEIEKNASADDTSSDMNSTFNFD